MEYLASLLVAVPRVEVRVGSLAAFFVFFGAASTGPNSVYFLFKILLEEAL